MYYELRHLLYQVPNSTGGLLWCKLDVWCWWDICHKWISLFTWRWWCFTKALQAEHLNEVDYGSRTHIIRYCFSWGWVASWTPYGFTCGWKPVLAISMNCDNQTVIIKINSSKDNMKSTRHIKRCLKSVRKLRNSEVVALSLIHIWRCRRRG